MVVLIETFSRLEQDGVPFHGDAGHGCRERGVRGLRGACHESNLGLRSQPLHPPEQRG